MSTIKYRNLMMEMGILGSIGKCRDSNILIKFLINI